jgi:hypothetical protein
MGWLPNWGLCRGPIHQRRTNDGRGLGPGQPGSSVRLRDDCAERRFLEQPLGSRSWRPPRDHGVTELDGILVHVRRRGPSSWNSARKHNCPEARRGIGTASSAPLISCRPATPRTVGPSLGRCSRCSRCSRPGQRRNRRSRPTPRCRSIGYRVMIAMNRLDHGGHERD